ncbi:MAG: HepT-like ribonuclease domain-containing protein [Kineosporiaceae bacterium]
MTPPERLYLSTMLDACRRIVELTSGCQLADVESDPTRRDALLWNFTVVGEAAGQVGESIRAAQPGIPWRRMTGTRNRIVHGYWSVDLDLLVTTAQQLVPDVINRLEAVMRDIEA